MADLSKIVDELSSLTVLEAADLAKMLEEKWGVSAAAAVAVAGPAGGGAAAAPAGEAGPSAKPGTIRELSRTRHCVGKSGPYIPASPYSMPSGEIRLERVGRAGLLAANTAPDACPDGRDWMAAIRRAV